MIQASGHFSFLNSLTSDSDWTLAGINSDLLVETERTDWLGQEPINITVHGSMCYLLVYGWLIFVFFVHHHVQTKTLVQPWSEWPEHFPRPCMTTPSCDTDSQQPFVQCYNAVCLGLVWEYYLNLSLKKEKGLGGAYWSAPRSNYLWNCC